MGREVSVTKAGGSDSRLHRLVWVVIEQVSGKTPPVG
jgi:hypothetical protein